MVAPMWEALSPAAMATLFRYIQIVARRAHRESRTTCQRGHVVPHCFGGQSFLMYYPEIWKLNLKTFSLWRVAGLGDHVFGRVRIN